MARKLRSDCTVKTAEKKMGLPPGTIRNPNGRDTRGDKRIGTIREEASRGKSVPTNRLLLAGETNPSVANAH